MTPHGLDRRTLLAAALLTPVSLVPWNRALARAGLDKNPHKGNGMLVAYLTRSGNTKVIAGTLHRALGGELFEIRTAQPYPEDYEATVEQARRERDAGLEPPLAALVPSLAQYDTVFLGFPIWGETTPPPVRSFLRTHNLAGKTIRPFITHGGFGIGNAMTVLRSHAPKAHIEPPFVLEADQERRTLNEVRGWLGSINAA